jgi:hypothetical protein
MRVERSGMFGSLSRRQLLDSGCAWVACGATLWRDPHPVWKYRMHNSSHSVMKEPAVSFYRHWEPIRAAAKREPTFGRKGCALAALRVLEVLSHCRQASVRRARFLPPRADASLRR